MGAIIFAGLVFLAVVLIADPLAALMAWFHFTFFGWLRDFDPFGFGIDTRAKARTFYRWGIMFVGLTFLVVTTAGVCITG